MVSNESSGKKLEFDEQSSANTTNEEEILDTIENKYKVLKKIGEGKTSTVYLVNHLFLNNHLAIKLFRDKYWENEKRFTRAQREAQTLAAIDHINVVKVFDFGVTQDGAPYIVQEYVKGTNLKELVSENGALNEKKALKLIVQIAQGLDCLHENRILHRDIKSLNVIINEDEQSADERVKLIDLGIARPDETDGAIQSLTQSGTHVGSPYYMSPEACKGGEIDNSSDIYSLGCVMYEVLSGHLPFRADSALKTLEMHINDEAKPLTEFGVSAKTNKIVQKCLSKNKEDRYPNCKKLISDLNSVSGDSGFVSKYKNAIILVCLFMLPLIAFSSILFSKQESLQSTLVNSTNSTVVKKHSEESSKAEIAPYIEETTRANILSRLHVTKRAIAIFKQAMKSAESQKASDIEKCILAEEYTHSLLLADNPNAIEHIYTSLDKPLKAILKSVKEDPNYSKKLGSVPLLCQNGAIASLAEKDYFTAQSRIDNGLKLLAKHPDRKYLVPYLNITKSKCLTKTLGAKKGLELISKTKSQLEKMLGKHHFLYINAVLTESRIYETDKNYEKALISLNEALKCCQYNTNSINTSFLIIRKHNLARKLKESQSKKP